MTLSLLRETLKLEFRICKNTLLDDKIKPDTLYAITMNEVGFFTSLLNHWGVVTSYTYRKYTRYDLWYLFKSFLVTKHRDELNVDNE